MSADKPFNIYTDSNAAAPNIPLADGERLISIAAESDPPNIMTIRITAANLDVGDVIKVSGAFKQDWDGLIRGPGLIAFGGLGANSHYVVTTENP